MKIIFITMDPLENNTSANIRNMGLIQGLNMLGHVVDTYSLTIEEDSYGYDNTVNLNAMNLRRRYFFETRKIYNKLRTRKKDVIDLGNEDTKSDQNPKPNRRCKQKLIAYAKVVVQKLSIYDLQKVNVKNVKMKSININEYEVVLSSSDPKSSHLIAERLMNSANEKVKWIQYWGDPMLGDITTKDNFIKRKMIRKEEGRLLHKADGIVYTSPLTLERQKTVYAKDNHKMVYTIQASLPLDSEMKTNNSKLTLGYFGNIDNSIRNLNPICNVVREMDVRFIIAGDGKQELNGCNIIRYAKVDFKRVKELEESCDILICICNSRGTQIPGKIYYVSAYQKPIIVIVDGENAVYLNQFFSQFDRYIVCNNIDDSIRLAVEQAKIEIKEGKKYTIPNEMKMEQVARVVLKSLEKSEENRND